MHRERTNSAVAPIWCIAVSIHNYSGLILSQLQDGAQGEVAGHFLSFHHDLMSVAHHLTSAPAPAKTNFPSKRPPPAQGPAPGAQSPRSREKLQGGTVMGKISGQGSLREPGTLKRAGTELKTSRRRSGGNPRNRFVTTVSSPLRLYFLK